MTHTPDTLRAFSSRVATAFNEGRIRHPVHLDGGNEAQLIEVFRSIAPTDWVCGSWRMQAKALLHGVPEDELFQAVSSGRSISLCFPEHRIVSSAIVGGILPIALGIAWSIKRRGGSERVHCFLGDMTQGAGIFDECERYAVGFDLPIRWIVENNHKSVATPTLPVWGVPWGAFRHQDDKTVGYEYEPTYPHAGAGKRVNF